jgi:hypothetical protein
MFFRVAPLQHWVPLLPRLLLIVLVLREPPRARTSREAPTSERLLVFTLRFFLRATSATASCYTASGERDGERDGWASVPRGKNKPKKKKPSPSKDFFAISQKVDLCCSAVPLINHRTRACGARRPPLRSHPRRYASPATRPPPLSLLQRAHAPRIFTRCLIERGNAPSCAPCGRRRSTPASPA